MEREDFDKFANHLADPNALRQSADEHEIPDSEPSLEDELRAIGDTLSGQR